MRLLDWIWVSSCTNVADRVSQWTLCNYLRSDRHYLNFQFVKSLTTSATRGDFVVVRWLLDHFSNFEVPRSAIKEAAKRGDLHVLKLLLTYSYDDELDVKHFRKQKIATDRWQGIPAKKATTDRWEAMLAAAEGGQAPIVRWLVTTMPHDKNGERYERVIRYVLRCGDDDLVQFLLPKGRCVLDYADMCPRHEVVEWMFKCGYLGRDAFLAGYAIRDLVGTNRLDLMKQIAQQHLPLPEGLLYRYSDWFYNWYSALRKACDCGELHLVQWLMAQPTGVIVLENIQENWYRENLISVATGLGHCEVAKFLLGVYKIRNYNDSAIFHAISGGHVCCVKAMIEQYLIAKRQPTMSVIDYAAIKGRLEIVQFLHNFTVQDSQKMLRAK